MNNSLPVEVTEILTFAYRMAENAYFNRIGNIGKNRSHTTKQQLNKKSARRNNRRAKRNNR